MMADGDRLIVFTRYPEAGRNKTRLIPTLGAVGAAQLHQRMTQQTLDWAERLTATRPVELRIQFAGADETAMAECFGSRFTFVPQCEGDLGQRLERAIRESFQGGCRHVVVVGTDCPTLSAAIVGQAFDHLQDHDLVIGPAADGGYYLIGLAKHVESLFVGIAWSTDQVLAQTLAVAIRLNLSIALLPTLNDVDRPEDVARWEQAQTATKESTKASISIIIPTLNEEPLLEAAIESTGSSDSVERIIVAAGRFEESLELAIKHRCRFLTSPRGRAKQMNVGARAACNPVILFLHADTQLPPGFETVVSSTMSRPGIAAGAFSLKIDADGWKYRLIERGVALRSRWCQMPYGDQALFLRRELFESLKGFSDLPVMEDFELVRRLQRAGRIVTSPLTVRTSARRWQALGPIRTTWMNQRVIAGYYLGVPCERLAIWYRAEKTRCRQICDSVASDTPSSSD